MATQYLADKSMNLIGIISSKKSIVLNCMALTLTIKIKTEYQRVAMPEQTFVLSNQNLQLEAGD